MKKLLLAIAAACGLAAQTKVNAEIPFAFSFQGKTMAAGSYQVVRTGTPQRITVQNQDTGETILSLCSGWSVSNDEQSALIFTKVGDSYFLRSVVDGVRGGTYHVPNTRLLKEAMRAKKADVVYVAAK